MLTVRGKNQAVLAMAWAEANKAQILPVPNIQVTAPAVSHEKSFWWQWMSQHRNKAMWVAL